MNKYEEAMHIVYETTLPIIRTGGHELCKAVNTLEELVEKVKWHPYPAEKPTEDGKYLVRLQGKRYETKEMTYMDGEFGYMYTDDFGCKEWVSKDKEVIEWQPIIDEEEQQ